MRLGDTFYPILELITFRRQQLCDLEDGMCCNGSNKSGCVADRLADLEFVIVHGVPHHRERPLSMIPLTGSFERANDGERRVVRSTERATTL